MTVEDLAASLHLSATGNIAHLIESAAALEDAQPTDLAFVSSPKFFPAAKKSKAGCLIAPPAYPAQPNQTIIESPQPRAHFARALSLLYPDPPPEPLIHPSAVLAQNADIHPTAIIGPYVTIGPHARVGPHTIIHAHATLYHNVTIGARCIIHSGAVIGADGFGFEFEAGRYLKVPQVGTVHIGDDVEIGANSCIDRAALGVTSIGDGCKLDNMVHIAHNCQIGRHVIIAAQTGLAGSVRIGDYAIIGGQVGVGDKARIESKAIVGSGAGILTSKIVRAGEPVWGTPARPLRQHLAQLAALSRLAKKPTP